MLKQPGLFQEGFHLDHFTVPQIIKDYIQSENWQGLDAEFKKLTSPEGSLFDFLKQFHDFDQIEFIISIRDSHHEWEEDGIWHDDGSRVFAFSLSLTLDPVEGGKLGFRKKTDSEFHLIPTPPFGGIILFLTGVYGYEHKIHKVTQGKRIIIAGWCS